MQPIKIRGIVVRSTDVGDYNKMLTVLSGEKGRISIWAKGVKSSKSKMAAACSLLCYSEFVVTARGDNFTLSQATVIESFYHLREDIEKLSCAVYFAELAVSVCQEECGAEDVIRLLLNSLYFLEKGLKSINSMRAMFELRLLAAAGFMPDLNECTVCFSKDNLKFVSPFMGGAVCGGCVAPGKIKTEPRVLLAMQRILSSDLKGAFSYNFDDDTAEKVLNINEKFILEYIGFLPKTLDYLKSLGGI